MENKEALIGRKISSFEMGGLGEWVRFNFAEGDSVTLDACGDYCSRSWIESIDAPLALIGTVTDVEDIAMPNLGNVATPKNDNPDSIDYYGLKITTTNGIAVLDYRNDSNGYYGGSLEIRTDARPPQETTMTEPIDIPLPTPPDPPEEDGAYTVWTPDQQCFVMSAAAKAEFARYAKEHILPPDLFLQAILRNDLIEAVHLAPQEVVRHIPAFVFFLMHHAPGNSWGSQEAVEQWVKGKQEPVDDGFAVIEGPEVGGHA